MQVQNEKLVRVDQVLAQIRAPVDGMGSSQAAAAAMKKADVDRALVLLSIREGQGIKLLIKATGPVSLPLPASDGNDHLGRRTCGPTLTAHRRCTWRGISRTTSTRRFPRPGPTRRQSARKVTSAACTS